MSVTEDARVPSLESRLLALCNVCANVREAGPYQECSDYFSAARLLDVPQAFVAGENAIHAALIGRIPEGTVVCFRGTLAFDDTTRTPVQRLEDWSSDFDARLIEWVGSTDCHEGFANAVDALNMLELLPIDEPVIFAGHSKGGGMAQLAAIAFWLRTGRRSIVRTFGAPRPGGRSLAQAYARAPIDLVRFEASGDVVPHVPFQPALATLLSASLGAVLPHGLYDYQSVGTQRYITASGAIGTQQEPGVGMGIIGHWSLGQFDRIREAHSIEVGSRYWNGVNS